MTKKQINHSQIINHAISILDQIHNNNQTNSLSKNSSHPSILPDTSSTKLISTPALEQLRSRFLNPTTNTNISNNSNLHPDQSRSRKRPNHVIIPNSLENFLIRLKTFKLTNYPTAKPRFLSPPTMASFGWTCVEKNRLTCQTCQSSWVLAIPSNLDWSSNSGIQLGELGKRMRIDQHRPSCPWRNRTSPSSIYRTPRWKNSKTTAQAIIQDAKDISDSFFASGSTDLPSNFRVHHSLPEKSLTALSILLQSQLVSDHQHSSCLTLEPLILALFGWSTQSLLQPSPECTLPKNPTTRSSFISPSSSNPLPSHSPSSSTTTLTKQPVEQKVLHCKLCHRQALPSQNLTKVFNPITEHREYCPFVDKLCGFEQEQEVGLVVKKPGWEQNLEIIENFIHRMNPIDHDKLDGSTYLTLEHIANQFSSSYLLQSNHDNTFRDLSSSTRSLQVSNPVSNLDSSPHITLLNFVKSALTVASPSSKFHP